MMAHKHDLVIVLVIALFFGMTILIGQQGEPTGFATIDSSANITNAAPLVNTTVISIREGQTLNMSHYAYDPNLDPFNITVTGIYFNGTDTWTPGFFDEGTYLVTVNLTDGLLNSSVVVTIIVEDARCNLSIAINPDQLSMDLTWSDFFYNGSYSNYTIFYSSTFNISGIANGNSYKYNTTATTWTDTTANSVSQRYYQVEGHNSTSAEICEIIVGKNDIELDNASTGWNYVSLPFVQPNSSRDSVLTTVLGNIDEVWQYNTSGGYWNYWDYGAGSGTLYDLHPFKGYFIHSLDQVNVTFIGQPVVYINVSLSSAELNSLGWVHETTSRTTALQTINSNLEWVFAYDESSGTWNYLYEPFALGNINNIELAKGYFMDVDAATALNYSVS